MAQVKTGTRMMATAPKSASTYREASSIPAAMPRRACGSVRRRKTSHGPLPSDRATSSCVRVETAEDRGDVQVDDRDGGEREHGHGTPERRGRRPPRHPGVGGDVRRDGERHHDHDVPEGVALEVRPLHEPRRRGADGAGEHADDQREAEAPDRESGHVGAEEDVGDTLPTGIADLQRQVDQRHDGQCRRTRPRRRRPIGAQRARPAAS